MWRQQWHDKPVVLVLLVDFVDFSFSCEDWQPLPLAVYVLTARHLTAFICIRRLQHLLTTSFTLRTILCTHTHTHTHVHAYKTVHSCGTQWSTERINSNYRWLVSLRLGFSASFCANLFLTRAGLCMPEVLLCITGHQNQCNWTPGKARLWNDHYVISGKIYTWRSHVQRHKVFIPATVACNTTKLHVTALH